VHPPGVLILVVMRKTKISRRPLLAALVALAVCASLAACETEGQRQADAAGGETPTTSAGPTASTAKVTVAPLSGAVDVPPDTPVTVTATNGQLTQVALNGPAGAVAGALGADRATWTSTAALALGTAYTIAATAVDPAGMETTVSSTFTTLTPTHEQTEDVSMSPLEGMTVGAGMPVVLYLSDPVADDYRAAL
jgi:hypothetical protein